MSKPWGGGIGSVIKWDLNAYRNISPDVIYHLWEASLIVWCDDASCNCWHPAGTTINQMVTTGEVVKEWLDLLLQN